MSYDNDARNPRNLEDINDPEELRREIERTRGHLSQNVNALGEAVTPGNVARRQAEKVQDRVKGAGRGLRERIMGSDDDDTTYYTHSGGGDTYYARGDDEGRGVGDRVSDAASDAGDRLRGAADSARHNLEQAPSMARRQAQGNPLAAGLIALGAGWLLGSLLPATDRERELAHRAKDTAQEKGAPLVQEAKAAAQDAADHLKEPLQEAGDSLKASAADSVDKVKGEGQSAAQDVKSQAQDGKDSVQETRENS